MYRQAVAVRKEMIQVGCVLMKLRECYAVCSAVTMMNKYYELSLNFSSFLYVLTCVNEWI